MDDEFDVHTLDNLCLDDGVPPLAATISDLRNQAQAAITFNLNNPAPARSGALITCALPPHRPPMQRSRKRTTCTIVAVRAEIRTRPIPTATSPRTMSHRASSSQTTLAWASRPALVPFPWAHSTILLPSFTVALVCVTCSPLLVQYLTPRRTRGVGLEPCGHSALRKGRQPEEWSYR